MQGYDRPPVGIEASHLRNAVRLIHCLQKERGSSCAYYANNLAFEEGMMEARSASDAVALLIRRKDDVPIGTTLIKIRTMISNHKNPQESDDPFALHRIFVCFNTLISYVRDQYISSVIAAGIDHHAPTSPVQTRRRSLSLDINARLSLTATLIHESDKGGEREEEEQQQQPQTLIKASPTTKQSSSTKLPNSIDEESEDMVNGLNGSVGSPPMNHSPLPHSKFVGLSSSPGSKRVTFMSGKPQARRMLELLQLFVCLKESAGVERAILSSLLAFRGLNDPSYELLINDLILHVENQRSLMSQLESLPEGTPKDLVLELASLSPALQELQMIILSDIDSLKNAQYDVENIWSLISLYINKLHAVELFLIEELECFLPPKMPTVLSSASLSSMVSPQGPPGNATDEDPPMKEEIPADVWLGQIFASKDESVASTIEAIPPDLLKQRILEVLHENENGGRSSPQFVEGVDSYFSPATTNLKQEMNRFLDTTRSTGAPSASRGSEWEISIYELKFTKRIGVGAAATTYLADWSGQKVAVKVAATSRFGLDGWRTEVDALKRLHHPNIIRLLGSVYHETPLTYCLVLEYCNAGDLSTVLKYPTPKNFFFTVSLGIANAMQYLHARSIIHRDLKPANVLCDGSVTSGNFTVKLTDFGVATQLGDNKKDSRKGSTNEKTKRNLTGETGTYRWMASEVIRHEEYTLSADVYSFAIILWQLLTREEPFTDVTAVDAAQLVANEMQRPPIPPNTPVAVVDLIKVNWDENPTSRSTFEKISTDLRNLQDSLTPTERDYLESTHGHPVYEYDEPDVEVDPSPKKPTKASKQPRSSLMSSFFGQKRTGNK